MTRVLAIFFYNEKISHFEKIEKGLRGHDSTSLSSRFT